MLKRKKKREEERDINREVPKIESKIDTDPLGMWTGVPDNPYEEPVQDVDDL